MLRTVVMQTIVLSTAVGLVVSGVLLLLGHPREGCGLLLGTAVGVCNEYMIASRVSRIGAFGSAGQTRVMLQVGTAMRFLMIGLATVVAIKLPNTMSIGTMLIGIIFPIILANVVGARYLLRSDQ